MVDQCLGASPTLALKANDLNNLKHSAFICYLDGTDFSYYFQLRERW
jgi:hypothetical protein